MRVAHVISSPAGIGGAERVLAELVQAGHSHGAKQLVLNPFASADHAHLASLLSPCTYQSYVCSRWEKLPHARSWLARELNEFRPTVVHAHLFHAVALAATLRFPTSVSRLLTHHHGDAFVHEQRPLRERVDRACCSRYDAVVAVSEDTRNFLIDRYQCSEDRLYTIPNGWSGKPKPRAPGQGRKVICVANFRRQKGHDVLLTAFADVARKLPDAQLILVGDGPLRQTVNEQTQALRLTSRVRFEGEVSDVWSLLAEADVFALPSHFEPLGLAALEAMAAGLPIVATRVGGLHELVRPGVNGMLVSPGDSGGLARAITEVLSSRPLAEKLGRASRALAAARRSDRMTSSYMALYQELEHDSAGGTRWN
jgi:glycosyltransferase involved in cell wall biosynthesis